MLSFSDVTFVLLGFVFVFLLSLNPPRGPLFNYSSICMCPDSPIQLANNYLCPLLICLFLVSIEMSLFPIIICPNAVFFLYEEYVVRFPSGCSFLPCHHVVDF